MFHCTHCGKHRDDMTKIKRSYFTEDLDGERIVTEHLCVWCLAKERADLPLYPDSDNLIGCPRCGNDMLRNRAVCHNCMSEINAYFKE